MKPLKLRNPPAPGVASSPPPSCNRVASICVKVPVPHLEGEYSYLVPEGFDIDIGSIVRVPFGSQVTTGFVTEVIKLTEQERKSVQSLKVIEKVVNKERWFDSTLLERSRRIASLYGGSLYSILNLATPRKTPNGKSQLKVFEGLIAEKDLHRRRSFSAIRQIGRAHV